MQRKVVITLGDGTEDPQDFEQLHAKLRTAYAPVGFREDQLVEWIAIYEWRLARVLRAENGEIRKPLDNVAMAQHVQQVSQANIDIFLRYLLKMGKRFEAGTSDEKLSVKERALEAQKSLTNLLTDPTGIAHLAIDLAEVKEEIEQQGYLSAERINSVVTTFVTWNPSLAYMCAGMEAPEGNDEKDGARDADKIDIQTARRNYAIALLDEQLQQLTVLALYARRNVKLRVDAECRSLALPDDSATDKILRYESHLSRLRDRAINELERLQRMRRGEKDAPSFTVNVRRG
jgi:hypothetical protein